jgi:hypothetical protein
MECPTTANCRTEKNGEDHAMIRRLRLCFSHRAKRREDELVAAAEGGHLEQVEKLLKAGTDPNAR